MILIVTIVFLLFFLVLKKSRRNDEIEINSAILGHAEVEKHAVEVARSHAVKKNSACSRQLLTQVHRNFNYILKTYKNLNDDIERGVAVSPAVEWLLDNFYIIEEQAKDIHQILSRKCSHMVPVLKSGYLAGYPRVYAIALELVTHTDGNIDEKVVINFIRSYQTQVLLSVAELWVLPVMLRIALIWNIKNICKSLNESQRQRHEADLLADIISGKEEKDESELLAIVKAHISRNDEVSPTFAVHLMYRLRNQGNDISSVLSYLDEKLAEQNTTAKGIASLEHQIQASRQVSIGNSIVSLKTISTMDWTDIFESLSQVEKILRQDPAEVYGRMDFESRDYYRHTVEKLARIYNTSETLIALKAVECASEKIGGGENKENPAAHVGYYLVGKGRNELVEKIGTKTGVVQTFASRVMSHPTALYLGSIAVITIGISLAFACYAAAKGDNAWLLIVMAVLAVLIPASDLSVAVVNFMATRFYTPAILPKLELKEGIPEDLSTMVIVPTLLPNEKRVRELLSQLEINYLANRENNIYFALVGDFKDADASELPEDKDIVSTALNGIDELNRRYSSGERKVFYYFHRHRQLNVSQNKWMGWERKRGAIIEFNDLILGSANTSYSIMSCGHADLPHVKYIITLDSDTSLPMGNAKRLIGTIAHPMNRAVIDRQKGRVLEGYGLLQPRIDVNIISANSTLFSRIFAGQGGIDPYTTAVSDVYQDLFGEGIFTGKGIYDLNVFQEILKDAIPDNTVLSHDLLEGSYVRTGLVTDISMVDGYPARFNSYAMRLHRWVRGDWQLMPWLGTKVRDRHGNWRKNPLSTISRWKILDNLRRSLVNPSLIILILLGLCVLPGSSLVWIGLAVVDSMLPSITYVLHKLFSYENMTRVRRRNSTIIAGFKASVCQSVLQLAFMPYLAYLMCDAVARTIIRVLITRRNMLEWVTAADMEVSLKNDVLSFWKRMWISSVLGFLVFTLAVFFAPEAVTVAALLLVLWSASPNIAYTISKKFVKKAEFLEPEGILELRRIARKTWRYFEDMVTSRDNYLPPDNYQEEPPNGIAHRTSPTNIGLMLASVLSARDLGYIGIIEMGELLKKSIAVIEKLDKWHGHLYNWYNTTTLNVLKPRYVSTVDSGNFVAYLMVLEQGLRDCLDRKIVDANMIMGLKDTILLFNEEHKDNGICIDIARLSNLLSGGDINIVAWKDLLDQIMSDLHGDDIKFHKIKKSVWGSKLIKMLDSFRNDLASFMPLVHFTAAGKNMDRLPDAHPFKRYLQNVSLKELLHIYEDDKESFGHAASQFINANEAGCDNKFAEESSSEHLKEPKEHIAEAHKRVEEIIELYENLSERVRILAKETKFAPLYDPKRQLFSIGYDIEENRLTKSYYDLLASEARQASYIAIARGEIDKRHWFKLGRRLTLVEGLRGLVSWTGTMFEYLMPLLTMKNFENTLLDETYDFVVRAQKKYGMERKIPWGTSESAYYAFDINLNYQYRAFGVPELGLKRGLVNDMVVAPYATVLALGIDPKGVLENIRKLCSEGMEGAYGLYEAIDYTPSRLRKGMKSSIVKNFMVHHQGMSLLALNNYLNNNVIQERFHKNPVIKAAELLLQERIPEKAFFTKEYKEKVAPVKRIVQEDGEVIRKFGVPCSELPAMHILSNGNYSVMVTDGGAGFSKCGDIAVSRWKETLRDTGSGMFIFIQNINSNNAWSATYDPFNAAPEEYSATFSPDKALFVRKDGNIETRTEIIVSTEENAEIRRVTLCNHSEHTRILEATSYFEVVLAQTDADQAHPAFSKLFVITEFDSEHECLLASRRPRSKHQKTLWAMHSVTVEGEMAGNLQYETDRAKFIGRNRDLSNPLAMDVDQPLSNTTGSVLDPVMSLRRRVIVKPGQSVRISYITAIGESRRDVLELAEKYSEPRAVERAFELAWNRSQIESRYLGFKASEVEIYLDMMPSILLPGPLRRKWSDMIIKNKRGQSGLWKFGISGDMPVILVILKSKEEISIVSRVLKAHEFWRLKGLYVDIVIVIEDESNYSQPLHDAIRDEVSSSHARNMIGARGGIFILDANHMEEEDLTLIHAVAKIVLKSDGGPIEEQISFEGRYKSPQVLASGVSNDTNAEVPRMESACQCFDASGLIFFNGMGGFSADGREYVIYLKDGRHTPVPWINVISNPQFGFIITEAGGGYTWSENSRENKLTPWSNDPISDTHGEVLYVRDDDSGEFWTITPFPASAGGDYVIRHGHGYTVFEHSSHGIEQELTEFVPVKDTVKICMISLKNTTRTPRKLSLTYYIRPVLGVNEKVTAPYIVTRMHEETGILLITNAFNADFPCRVAFMDTSEANRSYTGDRTEFIGLNGSISEPDAMKRHRLSGMVGAGLDPCAALQINIQLNPCEKREVVFTLGQGIDTQKALLLAEKYRKLDAAKSELENVKEYWRQKLETIQVYTPDASMNMLLNGWLQYQVISCRLWARSAFYQSGGAYGYRDQLQDVMAVVYTWPELTRRQILLHCAHQFIEGDVQHWWHPGAGKGIRTRYSDDYLWLPYVTADYIRNTGDWGILDEVVNYIDDEPLEENEDERYDVPRLSEEKSSVYEHCIRAIDNGLKFGIHGIPLMGCGDWNDGMNTVGNKGRGESVWLGWFLYTVLTNFIPVCLKRNDIERAEKYRAHAENIAKAIEVNAWDGSWYRRAYFDDGTPLGAAQNTECRIDAIAQSWSSISGAGMAHRVKEAMHAVRNYLIDSEAGIIKLLTPPFNESDLDPGYIKGYVPGVRENGGQYTHAAVWTVLAFARLGEGDTAWELYHMINPINHSRTPIESARYKVEPYVMAADVYAVYPNTGRGGWTWYTGAAGWMYRVGLEHMLGIKKNENNIVFEPCIPRGWREFKVRYKVGEAVYHIIVRNPDGANKGVKTVALDGKLLEGLVLPLADDAAEHQVEVVMG